MLEAKNDKGKRPQSFFVSPYKISDTKPIPQAPAVASTSKNEEPKDDVDDYRHQSTLRLRSVWESIAERYSHPSPLDDEVSLEDMTIVNDKGFLRNARRRPIGFYGLPGERVHFPSWYMKLQDEETGSSSDDDDDIDDNEDDEESTYESDDELGQWDEGECAIGTKAREERRLRQEALSDLNEFMAAEMRCRGLSADPSSISSLEHSNLSSPLNTPTSLLRNVNALRLTSTTRSLSPLNLNPSRSSSLRSIRFSSPVVTPSSSKATPSSRSTTRDLSNTPLYIPPSSPPSEHESKISRPIRAVPRRHSFTGVSSKNPATQKITNAAPATSPLRNLSNEYIPTSRAKFSVDIQRNSELRRHYSQKENPPEPPPTQKFSSPEFLSGDESSSESIVTQKDTSFSLPSKYPQKRKKAPIPSKTPLKDEVFIPPSIPKRPVSPISPRSDSDDDIICIYPSEPCSTPTEVPSLQSSPQISQNARTHSIQRISSPRDTSSQESSTPRPSMRTAPISSVRGSLKRSLMQRSSSMRPMINPDNTFTGSPIQRSASVRPVSSLKPQPQSLYTRSGSLIPQIVSKKPINLISATPNDILQSESIQLGAPPIPAESSDDDISMIPSTPLKQSMQRHTTSPISIRSTPDRIEKMLLPEPPKNKGEGNDTATSRKSVHMLEDSTTDDEFGQWKAPTKKRRVF